MRKFVALAMGAVLALGMISTALAAGPSPATAQKPAVGTAAWNDMGHFKDAAAPTVVNLGADPWPKGR